ncbi:MAG: M56 family metallopeptidase [Clostridia bacterium]|nr:M56 family metallopeptidase [Clostridia bacterium]
MSTQMSTQLHYLFRVVSQEWISSMWSAFWQGAVALAVVWTVCRAFPRIPAAARCWLWRLGLAKSLLGLLAIPQIDLALLPRARTVLARVVSDSFAAALPTRSTLIIRLSRPVMALWIVGVAIGVVRIVIALARARSMARRCVSVRYEELDAAMTWLCRGMGLSRRPEVVAADWASVPMILRSASGRVVVVPVELLAPARREDLLLALAHELAHIKRNDLTWNWLPTAGKVLFFLNPLVWAAGQELGIAQEMACDELAIRATGAGVARYGKLLLTMIRPRCEVSPRWAVAMASAGASAKLMRRRLIELKRLGDAPVGRLVAAVLTLVLVCMLVAPFRIVEAPRDGALRPVVSGMKVEIYIDELWGVRR